MNAMASSTRKSKDNKTSEQRRTDFVIEACKENDEKIKSLNDKLETEKLRLAALSKLVQLRQGALNVSSPNVVQDQLVQWLGVVPSVDSVKTLARKLENDLSVTRTFSGCNVTNCRVVNLDVSRDVVHRLYEAALLVGIYRVQLSVESKLQVMTGEEAVCAVQQLVITPALPQLVPLQQQVATSYCLYILPRALHKMHVLEEGQHEVLVWAEKIANLEIASTTLRLLLSYVPLRTSITPLFTGKNQSSKQSRAAMQSMKKPPLTTNVKQEQDSQESIEEVSEDDGCVTLRWEVAYCQDIRNFRYNFELEVPQSVLELYSMSPVLPLLNGDQTLRSAGDVIRVFSSLSH